MSKASLTFIKVRTDSGISSHPFSLLSDHIEREYRRDPAFFDFNLQAAAGQFLTTQEYQTHPLVQLCKDTDTLVIPLSIYGDGVQVTEAPSQQSIYVVYLAFLHREMDELSLPLSKHVYTVYRKTEDSQKTFDDICKVLVWELLALQHGRKPQRGQEGKPFAAQLPGEYLCEGWGRRRRFCLMQYKGDGDFLRESLGLRAHNSLRWMCPWCSASRDGNFTWKDFSLSAPWMSTIRTQQSTTTIHKISLLFTVGEGGCKTKYVPADCCINRVLQVCFWIQ